MGIGKKWFKSLVLVAGVGLLVSACGTGGQQNAGSGTGTSGSGAGSGSGEKVYVVGTDAAYPPFQMLEADKISGHDIDVMNAIAEAGGFKIEWKNTGWDPLFDGLDKGTVDIGISSITITDKRKEKYDFSEPYFEANQLILVAEDSPVTKLADLQGKKIGVQAATTGEEVVKKAFGDTYQGLMGYDDMPSSVDDFFNGRVDAVVGDNGVLQYYVNKIKDKKFKLIKDDSFEKEYYGIMVKKGNTDALNKINDGLKKIKENGKLQEIYNQYFGSN
ncbi:basic amino acid ABC transporter substrate-binding protein [Brevibacillus sp. SAFN-007a]|uniref:basic amino acid ABC transporter substrate-binding protein n=1 Tax=Brevibacillus sp. SAFN-007a TaxID=3436862 RepID=UPI003F7D175B